MRKLTSAETFLLHNWSRVERLEESTAALRSWMFDAVIEALGKRPWWTKEFRVERYPSRGGPTTAIHVLKAAWKVKEVTWHWYAFGMQDLSPSSLLGLADPPSLYVWAPDGNWPLRSAFDRAFWPVAKRISRPLGLWDEGEECVSSYIRRPPERWLRLLETGRFTEEVCIEFDKLARLITPIDRALAKVRANTARKKR